MARSGAARLRVVDERPLEEPTGDIQLTEEAMSEWSAGQRRCRGRKRHNWGPHTVFEHVTFYEVVERCSHCRNRRRAEFTKRGRQATKWKPDYRDGYLLPKGAARITGDLQDNLVLADILSRRIVEVVDDEDDVNA